MSEASAARKHADSRTNARGRLFGIIGMGTGSPILALFAPDGTRVTINAFGEAVLDQTGACSIFVANNGNNQTLNYNLSLACISGDCNLVQPPMSRDA